jgi:very-short-patch-repair endonuclease
MRDSHDIHADHASRERTIATVAARQHGVVTQRQLAALGLGRGAIAHRMAMGRLHRVAPGVLAVGHARIGRPGRYLAAVLSCGDGAVLSHGSAAALWALLPARGTRIEVTVTGRLGGRPGIVIHRVRTLEREDRAQRDGVPVTSVARTLLDLAEVVTQDRLERAFEEAERLRLLDMNALRETAKRSFGCRALKRVHALLAREAAVPETRSELERRFAAFCRDAGLPTPAFNALVAGFEVDATWPGSHLVVELDGWDYHRTRAAFERDRARDAALLVSGHRVLRVTHRRMVAEPAAIAGAIRGLLEAA